MKLLHEKNEFGDHYLFYCPGCKHHHGYTTNTNGRRPSWDFNGDMNNPTFSPSLLCWVPNPDGSRDRVCHLYVKNGQIEYLSDCFHEFAGKTIPLEDLENT